MMLNRRAASALSSLVYASYIPPNRPLMKDRDKGTKNFAYYQIFYRLFLLFSIRINIFLISYNLTYHARCTNAIPWFYIFTFLRFPKVCSISASYASIDAAHIPRKGMTCRG